MSFKLRKFEFSADSRMKRSMESQTITCSLEIAFYLKIN